MTAIIPFPIPHARTFSNDRAWLTWDFFLLFHVSLLSVYICVFWGGMKINLCILSISEHLERVTPASCVKDAYATHDIEFLQQHKPYTGRDSRRPINRLSAALATLHLLLGHLWPRRCCLASGLKKYIISTKFGSYNTNHSAPWPSSPPSPSSQS